MKGYRKVPFRECYTTSIWQCIRWTIWCHVVLRLFPNATERDPSGG